MRYIHSNPTGEINNALFLEVCLSPLNLTNEWQKISAKIDTGADITILPKDFKKNFQIKPVGLCSLSCFRGK